MIDHFDIDPAVAAALLWDVPRLQREADGRLLVEAFGPPPFRPPDDAADDGERTGLWHAAMGVFALQLRDEEEARKRWSPLDGDDPSTRLLRYALMTWAFQPLGDASVLSEMEALTAEVRPTETRARLLRRLSMVALELGEDEVYERSMRRGLEIAPKDTPLASSFQMRAWSRGWRESPPVRTFVDDPLTSQPWIRALAFSSTAESALNEFIDSLKGAWSFTFRMGRRPIDKLHAAQGQADWACALGLRDELRRLLSAHILAADETTASEKVWAAEIWLLAGGKERVRVLRRIERHLTGANGTALLERLLASPRRSLPPADLGRGLWDIVDDKGIRLLLEGVDPGSPDDVGARDARRVWGNLLWRAPDHFIAAWSRLDEDRRVSALGELSVNITDRLPAERAEQMLVACAQQPDTSGTRALGVALATNLERFELASRLQASLDPMEVRSLLAWRPDSVDMATARHAIEATRASVEGTRRSVLDGTIPLGAYDARHMLGELTAMVNDDSGVIAELLADIALDVRMPPDHLLGALQGLWALQRVDMVALEILDRIRESGDAVGPSVEVRLESEALRAAKLRLLGGHLLDDETRSLLAWCRRPTVETRLLALAALLEHARRGTADHTTTTALYGALYDPSDDMVVTALGAVAEGLAKGGGDRIVGAAARTAYEGSGTRVRVAAVRAAMAVGADTEAAIVLERAAKDPSWQVRVANETSAASAE